AAVLLSGIHCFRDARTFCAFCGLSIPSSYEIVPISANICSGFTKGDFQMKIRFGGLIVIAFVIVTTFLLIPPAAMPQSAASKDIPRLPNGKPDFSGVWDHPRVLDVTRDGKGRGGGT